MNFSVVLVGVGNMGGAMLRGWIAIGMSRDNVTVIDPASSDKMLSFLKDSGIRCVDAADDVAPPDVLLIAVKPQMMDKVLPGLAGIAGPDTVAVSVAAGTTIAKISAPLGNPAVIRAMPNTPSLVLRGMTVCCPNEQVTVQQRANVDQLLQAIGKVEWVEDEALIDAVTAVSGSGPAYVFHLAECMADAAKAAGLPDELAMTLAIETVSGAGELLRQSDDEPAILRQNVTSPGGTTAAALEILMGADGMPQLLERAIMAAKKRAQELS